MDDLVQGADLGIEKGQNLREAFVDKNIFTVAKGNTYYRNNKKFNVIYIDASHFYDDVKKDFINSMNCLTEGGILICDDFFWFFYEKKIKI